MDILSSAKDFQTAIVGILGFAGVILTLMWNAFLSRRSQRKAIAHQQQTLRTALIEELRILRDTHFGNAARCIEAQRENSEGICVPLYDMTDVYDKLLTQIGLLNPTEVQKIMHTYLAIKQAKTNIFLFSRREISGKWLLVPPEHFSDLQHLSELLIPDIDSAIAALGGDTTSGERKDKDKARTP